MCICTATWGYSRSELSAGILLDSNEELRTRVVSAANIELTLPPPKLENSLENLFHELFEAFRISRFDHSS